MRGVVSFRRLVALSVLAAMALSSFVPGVPASSHDSVATIVLACEKSPVIANNFPQGYTSSFESAWIPLSPGTPVLGADRRGCAAHLGHHTYLPGNDTVYALQGGSGFVFYVEQFPYSPADQVPAVDTEGGVHLVTRVIAQASIDGRTWTDVATGNYRLVAVIDPTTAPDDAAIETICFNTGVCNPSLSCISIPYGCQFNPTRQLVFFDFLAAGQEFRFFRVSLPPSIYTGLSGFMDNSRFFLDVTEVGAYAPPATSPQTVSLSCDDDIMEIFLSDSPCRFGGYVTDEGPVGVDAVRVGNIPGQWDAPSFFHTYPLGDAYIDNVSGRVLVRDYRTNGEGPNRAIYVEVSPNGEDWERVHTFSVAPVPADLLNLMSEADLFHGDFNVTGLNGTHARFLRLVAEPLPGESQFWSASTVWPDRHPWSYFHDSSIEVTGELPT